MATLPLARRAFCAGVTALAVLPTFSLIPTAPCPDAKIIAAVAAWLDLSPLLTAIMQRRDDAFDASRALVGDCPMGDVDGNHRWHDAWNKTPCGLLEWEWERVAAIADGHLTYATNTRAVTAEGIAAKITLYKAAVEFYVDDGDDYMLDRIERDIAAFHGEA